MQPTFIRISFFSVCPVSRWGPLFWSSQRCFLPVTSKLRTILQTLSSFPLRMWPYHRRRSSPILSAIGRTPNIGGIVLFRMRSRRLVPAVQYSVFVSFRWGHFPFSSSQASTRHRTPLPGGRRFHGFLTFSVPAFSCRRALQLTSATWTKLHSRGSSLRPSDCHQTLLSIPSI